MVVRYRRNCSSYQIGTPPLPPSQWKCSQRSFCARRAHTFSRSGRLLSRPPPLQKSAGFYVTSSQFSSGTNWTSSDVSRVVFRAEWAYKLPKKVGAVCKRHTHIYFIGTYIPTYSTVFIIIVTYNVKRWSRFNYTVIYAHQGQLRMTIGKCMQKTCGTPDDSFLNR